jgi:hypothetical protein
MRSMGSSLLACSCSLEDLECCLCSYVGVRAFYHECQMRIGVQGKVTWGKSRTWVAIYARHTPGVVPLFSLLLF